MAQEQHQMQLVETHDTGAEEWHCPQCERRFVVQWPPQYKKIILEAGDEYAAHSGVKGGITMHSAKISESIHEPDLADYWYEALNELDFGDWPDDFPQSD
jgi:hypothetical protein